MTWVNNAISNHISRFLVCLYYVTQLSPALQLSAAYCLDTWFSNRKNHFSRPDS